MCHFECCLLHVDSWKLVQLGVNDTLRRCVPGHESWASTNEHMVRFQVDTTLPAMIEVILAPLERYWRVYYGIWEHSKSRITKGVHLRHENGSRSS